MTSHTMMELSVSLILMKIGMGIITINIDIHIDLDKILKTDDGKLSLLRLQDLYQHKIY